MVSPVRGDRTNPPTVRDTNGAALDQARRRKENARTLSWHSSTVMRSWWSWLARSVDVGPKAMSEPEVGHAEMVATLMAL